MEDAPLGFAAAAARKLTADQAGLMSPPVTGRFRCGDCVHFLSPGCSLVEGLITAEMCCNLFDGPPGSPSNEYGWLSGEDSLERVRPFLSRPAAPPGRGKGSSETTISGRGMTGGGDPGDRVFCFVTGARVLEEAEAVVTDLRSVKSERLPASGPERQGVLYHVNTLGALVANAEARCELPVGGELSFATAELDGLAATRDVKVRSLLDQAVRVRNIVTT